MFIRILLFFVVLLISSLASAQSLEEFNTKRVRHDQNLMIGLGSWATTNLVASGIGLANSEEGENRHFHQMNVMWNTVNLGLAIPGYIKARKENSGISLTESLALQRKTEKIFLINSGLDIGYISTGLILKSEAKSNPSNADRLNGFGNSLLLQGGFLFIFDLTAYCVHNSNYNKRLKKVLDKVVLSSSGLGLVYKIN